MSPARMAHPGDVLLCGALSHLPLASEATGADARGFATVTLPDHGLRAVAGGEHAVPVPAPGETVEGVLASGLTAGQASRLEYYLNVYGMTLGEAGPDSAGMRLPVHHAPSEADWDAALWRAQKAEPVLCAAREILAHRSTYSAEEMAQRLGQIRARADLRAKQRAQPPQAGHDPDRDVIVHRLHRPYLNFFAVGEADLQFRRQDGTMSPVVNRGALMMGEAAGVLPYDPVTDRVLLVQQFRAPLFLGGSTSPWAWEPVAGLVDPGETPEETAHREAMEEAGLTLWHLEPIGPTHGSPGSLSDRLNLYVGLADLTDLAEAGGLTSEGEDIRREILGFETFMAQVDARRYTVLPLLVLGLWLARHRDRLRAMA